MGACSGWGAAESSACSSFSVMRPSAMGWEDEDEVGRDDDVGLAVVWMALGLRLSASAPGETVLTLARTHASSGKSSASWEEALPVLPPAHARLRGTSLLGSVDTQQHVRRGTF